MPELPFWHRILISEQTYLPLIVKNLAEPMAHISYNIYILDNNWHEGCQNIKFSAMGICVAVKPERSVLTV